MTAVVIEPMQRQDFVKRSGAVMTEAARSLIDAFHALPPDDRREVLAELFRRSEADDLDQDLLTAADQLFRGYDAEEAVRRGR